MSRNKEKINRSIQFKNGSYNSVLTIIVIIIVIFINMAVRALPTTITTFDTSGVDYYSISDTTKKLLKELDKEVTIYMLSDASGGYNDYIETMCGIYKDYSKNINFKKVDVAIEPAFATKYNASSASDYSLIVEENAGGKYRVVDYTDMVYSNSTYDESGNSYYKYSYDAEGHLSSAINYVSNDKNVMIYEMGGHGELSISGSGMDDALFKSNYTLSDEVLELGNGGSIPEDCEVLFIYAPSSDYSLSEAELIKEYISAGGNVVVVYNNIYEADMTNFYSILEYVGITIAEGLIIEQDDDHYYGAATYPQQTLIPDKNNYSEITSDLQNSYLLTFYASPVKQIESDACTSKYTELLTTSSDYQVVYFDDEYTVDYTEPASVATYVESTFEGSDTTAKTLVIGSAFFFQDITSDESVLSNNFRFVTNAIKEMLGDSDSVYIEAKTLDEQFNVTTQSQINLYSIVYLGLIPLIFILGGITVSVIRRAK